ncbi:MAG: class I SAM-dependent methyltransferase [Ferruginibacter sp.]
MNHLTVATKIGEPDHSLPDGSFADQYNQLRTNEGRLYGDEVVKLLPFISRNHPHYKEWLIRKRSCNQLLKYIRTKNSSANILEIGCGNGWLTAKIANITSGQVLGLDINATQIKQARRVFGTASDCRFIEGNIDDGVLGDQKFDFIIFAASIQYFWNLEDILNTTLSHLTLQGEIHIIDSRFYRFMEIAKSQQKSKAYFDSMGCPAMAGYYYHHQIDNLAFFQRQFLFDPNSLWHKMIYRYHPFHWIVIKNGYQ